MEGLHELLTRPDEGGLDKARPESLTLGNRKCFLNMIKILPKGTPNGSIID
jgi:hypothetical protein